MLKNEGTIRLHLSFRTIKEEESPENVVLALGDLSLISKTAKASLRVGHPKRASRDGSECRKAYKSVQKRLRFGCKPTLLPVSPQARLSSGRAGRLFVSGRFLSFISLSSQRNEKNIFPTYKIFAAFRMTEGLTDLNIEYRRVVPLAGNKEC